MICIILIKQRIKSLRILDSSCIRMMGGVISPKIAIETPKFFLYLQSNLSIFSYRIYFQTITDNAWIEEDCFELIIRHLCYFLSIPVIKMFQVIFAFAKYCNPGKTCLCSFKYEKFEKNRIIMDRDSPLFIMILHIEWIISAPWTPYHGHGSMKNYFFFGRLAY